MLFSFSGGISIESYRRATQSKPIALYRAAAEVKLALKAPMREYTQTAAPGDYVLAGQSVAESADGFLLLSPVSGEVCEPCDSILSDGSVSPCIVIKNDLQYNAAPPLVNRDWRDLSREELIGVIRAAGISEKGGEPVSEKISAMLGLADTLIVRGFGDEPWAAAAYRTVCDRTADVVEGIEVICAVFGRIRSIVALCADTGEAAESIRRASGDKGQVRVAMLRDKYPQADEKLIISAITGRDCGENIREGRTLVLSAQSAAAIGRALRDGEPQLTAVITVAGDAVANPRTVEAPLGTAFSELAAFCGGYLRAPGVLIPGGAMRCDDAFIDDIPVCPGDDAFTALLYDYAAVSGECIRCGQCVLACPYGIMPNYVRYFLENKDEKRLSALGVKACTLCGACSYVCPAHIDLRGTMRTVLDRAQ